MAKKPKAAAAASRLDALLAVGDLRALRAEARVILEAPAASEADRDAARAALRHAGPERAAAIAAVVGLCFFAAVALLGILTHR